MVILTAMMKKPVDVFDRDAEWAAVSRFAKSSTSPAAFGVVLGRRRQGKSTLLDALCQATGGLRVQVVQGRPQEQRALIADQLAAFAGHAVPPSLADAASVLGAFADTARDHHARHGEPLVVVIDELPYLLSEEPSTTSILQTALDPGGVLASSPIRLLVCGSALTVMTGLLRGQAPLRGRARLELPVRPFDYRTAAAFWDLTQDLPTALRVYATVGGTPAYRREFVADRTPADVGGFDGWITEVVLDPTTPLFHEARSLLASSLEDAGVRERALYESLVAAVAGGATTPQDLASRIGRRTSDLAHPLAVLCDSGYLVREDDQFKQRAPRYVLTEPLLSFAAVVVRRNLALLQGTGGASRAWAGSLASFHSQVLGPAFEAICREWALRWADERALGGTPTDVGRAVVNDAGRHKTIEVDVVVREGKRVLALGEAHVGRPVDLADLVRLERARRLVVQRGLAADEGTVRLLAFSERGAVPEVAARADVEVVDLPRLYGLDGPTR